MPRALSFLQVCQVRGERWSGRRIVTVLSPRSPSQNVRRTSIRQCALAGLNQPRRRRNEIHHHSCDRCSGQPRCSELCNGYAARGILFRSRNERDRSDDDSTRKFLQCAWAGDAPEPERKDGSGQLLHGTWARDDPQPTPLTSRFSHPEMLGGVASTAPVIVRGFTSSRGSDWPALTR